MRAAVATRPAVQADMPAIVFLAQRIWPVCYAGVLTQEQIENLLARIYNLETLAGEVARGHRFWVAESGNEMVGFASAYKEKGIVWLKKLYVLPDRAGQGIGKALLKVVTDGFRPAQQQRLLVNENNKPAQHFYEHMGFRFVEHTAVTMGDYAFTDCVFARDLQ